MLPQSIARSFSIFSLFVRVYHVTNVHNRAGNWKDGSNGRKFSNILWFVEMRNLLLFKNYSNSLVNGGEANFIEILSQGSI